MKKKSSKVPDSNLPSLETQVASVTEIENKPDGSLDSCGPSTIAGWVLDRLNPTSVLEVEIRVDDELLGKVKADRFRIDLLENKIGEGVCGFEIPFPPALLDDRLHVIEVREASTGIPLRGSPSKVRFAPLGEKGVTPGYRGFFDACNTKLIEGWALGKV